LYYFVLSCLVLSFHVLSSHVFLCLVVYRLGVIPMGRPRGSTDKQQRKRRGRGGARDIGPITAVTPVFATSNNRRGNVTKQQRLFAAHFLDAPPVELSVGNSEGLSVGASVGLTHGTSNGQNCESEDTPLQTAEGQSAVLLPELPDLDSDSTDSEYVPSDSDCDSDSSECDDISRRITPDLDAAIKKLLHLRVNNATLARKLRKSHWLHTPASNHEDWFNGELKLRCVAPHLQFDNISYTCIRCHSSDVILKGWTHSPSARIILDIEEPYLLAAYTYECKTCGKPSFLFCLLKLLLLLHRYMPLH
jgi:hypothetical protein